MLLAHHRGFTGKHRIATVGGVVERIGEQGVTLTQPCHIKNIAALGIALAEPAADTTKAVQGDQAFIPTLGCVKGRGLCF